MSLRPVNLDAYTNPRRSRTHVREHPTQSSDGLYHMRCPDCGRVISAYTVDDVWYVFACGCGWRWEAFAVTLDGRFAHESAYQPND